MQKFNPQSLSLIPVNPFIANSFCFGEGGGEEHGGGGGCAISFQEQSLETAKLTKMAAFEIALLKNSREAGIQAGSRRLSYNQMESTLPIYHMTS